jgi:hypothetical protein
MFNETKERRLCPFSVSTEFVTYRKKQAKGNGQTVNSKKKRKGRNTKRLFKHQRRRLSERPEKTL